MKGMNCGSMPAPVSRTSMVSVVSTREIDTVTRAVRRREAHGVGDQVPQHLLQPIRIAHRRERAVELRDQRHLPCFGGGPAGVDGVHRHRRQIHVADIEQQFAAGDARHIEQVLDEPGLRVRIPIDAFERVLRLRPAGNWPRRSRWTQPTIALSGVRSSCDSVARNSSFRRLACCSRSSSSARSRCDAWISSSMRLKACDQHADLVARRCAWRGSNSRRDRRCSRAVVGERARSARRRCAAAAATAGTRAAGRRSRIAATAVGLRADARAMRIEIARDQQQRRRDRGRATAARSPSMRLRRQAQRRAAAPTRTACRSVGGTTALGEQRPVGRYRHAICMCGLNRQHLERFVGRLADP